MDEEAISAVGTGTKVNDVTRGAPDKAPRLSRTFASRSRLAPLGRAFVLLQDELWPAIAGNQRAFKQTAIQHNPSHPIWYYAATTTGYTDYERILTGWQESDEI